MSTIDYKQVLQMQPWLIAPNQQAIISYDVDGWATAVMLTHVLNWSVVGYYDSETLILKNGISVEDCIFIDVEIFRPTIRSLGHHLIVYDFNNLPKDFISKTKNCVNPNFIRRRDKKHFYTQKYPFGTFHFYEKLLSFDPICFKGYKSIDALSVIWFIDGVMNIYYKYHRNVLDWIQYLEMDNSTWYNELKNNAEHKVKSHTQTFINKISEIDDYQKLKKLGNFSPEKLTSIIQIISNKFGVDTNLKNWCLTDYTSKKFTRKFTDVNMQQDFNHYWNENPFSMCTYFKQNISYTVEYPFSLE